jgi:YegS/Rv2252/BmrU family lipid kinase
MGILFVVNPVAGKGKAQRLIPEIRSICSLCNAEYQIKETTKPGDAEAIAKWGSDNGYERIVAVGGDGTLNEVINGIAGTETSIGSVPGGSGNDFIRMINNHKDVRQIIADNVKGNIKRVDLGKCNDRYFINIGSCGMDAEVAAEMQKMKKYFAGTSAYIAAALQTVFTYKGRKLKIEIDDNKFEANTLLIAISNGRFYGGGVEPNPEADIADGYFDICFIRQLSRLKMISALPQYLKNKHEGIQDMLSHYRGRKVKITADRDIGINIDGEIIFNNIMNFDIIPGGINIIVPAEE